tara:strand:- start:1077 stop:1820 length:744 start_codon:yes stop_codon:yes gene_type:complete
MKLILLRHGESQWNLENRFTGWKDVSLTENGINEAIFSAEQINKLNISIESITTSILKRAQQTTEILIDILNYPKEEVKVDWRLNERHYGALQGLNKSETAKKYGEEQVKIWRRSYDTPPPMLSEDDKRHPKFDNKFNFIDSKNLPSGESLKMVIDRLIPFWETFKKNNFQFDKNHLIVAHSNSLRAIVKILDELSEEEIISINIPTGVPLVYNFDKNFNVIDKFYLIDDAILKEKQNIITNQGKAK